MIPFLTSQEIKKLVINDKKLLMANNMVYDITDYYSRHPGGNCIFKKVIQLDSKLNRLIFDDATTDFNFHSKNGKNIWKYLLIGTTRRISLCEKILMKFSFN